MGRRAAHSGGCLKWELWGSSGRWAAELLFENKFGTDSEGCRGTENMGMSPDAFMMTKINILLTSPVLL